MTVSPAATLAAPQAPAAPPTAVARNDGNVAATGFAQALLVAGFNDPASSVSSPLPAGGQISAGPYRGAKNARQQPKDEDKPAATAALTAPLPAVTALPLRIQPFPGMKGNPEEAGAMQSSLKETGRQQQPAPTTQGVASAAPAPVAAAAFNAAEEAPPDAGQPAVAHAAGADSVRETSNPPAPDNPPFVPAGELALAARLQPAPTASEPAVSSRPLQRETAASAQVSSKKVSASEVADPTLVTPSAAGAGSSTNFYGHASANSEVPSPPAPPALVAAPAFNTAEEAPPDEGQPAVTHAAAADSVRETSNPPAPVNPPLVPAGELAFAARVQPASTVSAAPAASPRPLQRETAVLAQVSSKKASESEVADPTLVTPIAAGAGSSLSSYGHASANSEVPSPPAAPPPTPPQPVEAKWAAELPPKPATVPLKDISLQVAQPGAQKVEVRLVQQSGELRVAVRTGDSDLAHGLQQGLSDLVGRLQESGFRAEAWRPASTVQSTPVFESRTNSGGSRNGDAQSYSGGSHQQEGERRQGQSQRPGWVAELENSMDGGEQSQGVSYGIGS